MKRVDTPEMRERYRNGEFSRHELVKDLDRRYRWDMFWCANNECYAEHKTSLFDLWGGYAQ